MKRTSFFQIELFTKGASNQNDTVFVSSEIPLLIFCPSSVWGMKQEDFEEFPNLKQDAQKLEKMFN